MKFLSFIRLIGANLEEYLSNGRKIRSDEWNVRNAKD
jgi:hypothetical protein